MATQIHESESAGRTTYFIDGEVSDANVVTLRWTMVDPDGEVHEYGQVTMPSNAARYFRRTVHKVLGDIEQNQPKAWTLETERQERPQSYARWSDEEVDRLGREFEFGLTEEQMAELHGRKPNAIHDRLHKVGRVPDCDGFMARGGICYGNRQA